MNLESRCEAFVALGDSIRNYLNGEEHAVLSTAVSSASVENPWFTVPNIRLALSSVAEMCDSKKLESWLSGYPVYSGQAKTIAVVMAGNIPLVGFHDFLCVLISGHKAMVKLSGKDRRLLPAIIDILLAIQPAFSTYITVEDHIIKNFDAVIATGGAQANEHFRHYFSKYPHIIRGHRNSCAVLTGEESDDELAGLFEDMFLYFGLGCRNVSKLYVPEGYDFTALQNIAAKQTELFQSLEQHHQYQNNYQYQKMILMINQLPFIDADVFLLVEKKNPDVQLSMIHYEYYQQMDSVLSDLNKIEDQIQCVVSRTAIPFGQAQHPGLSDYADNVDTLAFCLGLEDLNISG